MAKSVLSRAWNIAVVMLVFPTTSAFAAEPSPTLAPRPSPSPRAISDVLITTNARIGEELVRWGLILLVAAFAGMALAAVAKFLHDLLKPPTDSDSVAVSVAGFQLGAVVTAILGVVKDLIRTPAGIGALLVLLGVVQLLGIAAIEAGEISDAPLTEPASGAPASSPSTVPGSEVTSPSPGGEPQPSG